MAKPQQKVIIYSHGIRKKTMAEYHNEYRLATPGYFKCPACGRGIKKDPEGLLKRHFSDYPNRIHCPEGIGKSNPGGKRGKRGPYGPRKTKRVVDLDRKDLTDL